MIVITGYIVFIINVLLFFYIIRLKKSQTFPRIIALIHTLVFIIFNGLISYDFLFLHHDEAANALFFWHPLVIADFPISLIPLFFLIINKEWANWIEFCLFTILLTGIPGAIVYYQYGKWFQKLYQFAISGFNKRRV
jgi:hypothetical protein